MPHCSLECKSCYYKRFVVDTLVLFDWDVQVEALKNVTNACHPKMKFSFEKEQIRCFNF